MDRSSVDYDWYCNYSPRSISLRDGDTIYLLCTFSFKKLLKGSNIAHTLKFENKNVLMGES